MPPPYCYDHPRPSVTVDMVVFTLDGKALRVLLIRRDREPFADSWAIPGGFLDLDEPPLQAALRELQEETGLEQIEHAAPIGFFGEVDRDPRGRVISLAHAGVVRWPAPPVQGADDAREADWVEPNRIDALAFDHREILATALHWLLYRVQTGDVGLGLLPETFGLADIKRLYQALGGTVQGATAWRKRMHKSGRIQPVPGRRGKFRASAVAEPLSAAQVGADGQ